MNLKNSVFVLFFGLVFMASCVGHSEAKYQNAEEMVAAVKKNVNTIGMEDFKALLDKEVEIQIVDCREDYDFILGHIKGSLHIPRGVLEFSPKLSNRRLKTFIIGNEMGSAALAAANLRLLKYSEVYMLYFRWFDWEAKYPEFVEQGMGNEVKEEPKKEASSGGCGG